MSFYQFTCAPKMFNQRAVLSGFDKQFGLLTIQTNVVWPRQGNNHRQTKQEDQQIITLWSVPTYNSTNIPLGRLPIYDLTKIPMVLMVNMKSFHLLLNFQYFVLKDDQCWNVLDSSLFSLILSNVLPIFKKLRFLGKKMCLISSTSHA